jgi:hypothetical protein
MAVDESHAENSDGDELISNSAQRLYEFLIKSSPPRNASWSRDDWLQQHGVDADDQTAIREFALQIIAIVNEVRTTIDTLPPSPSHRLLGKHLPRIDEYVTKNAFSASRKIAADSPAEEVLYSLELCAQIFREHGIADKSVPQSGVEKMLDLIHELADEIRVDMSIPPTGRLYVLERLHEVERALLRIDLLGPAYVEATIDRLIGGSIAYPEIRQGSILDKLAKLWRGVHVGASGAKEVTEAASSVINLAHAISSGPIPPPS